MSEYNEDELRRMLADLGIDLDQLGSLLAQWADKNRADIEIDVNTIHMDKRFHRKGEAISTAGEIGGNLRKWSKRVGKFFEDPDDDWAPVMIVSSKTEIALLGMEIPEDEEAKAVLFEEVIPKTIRTTFDNRPLAMAVVLSSWTLVPGQETNDWYENRMVEERIRDHPERVEVLVCMSADRENDEIWMAKILRDGEQPPALQRWERFGDEDSPFEGRIPDMMRKILR